ncbi:MAG: DUF4386 domain-containing protein [Thermoplasmatota archaeon]
MTDSLPSVAHPHRVHRPPVALADRAQAQRLARLTGVLFLITYATSIPALLLYGPVLDDPNYVTGPGADAQILLAAFLELLLIVANVGSSLTLYPILKRQNGPIALGFVAARILESVFIAVGILSVLAVVTLRQASVGMEAGALIVVGQALVAVKDWTFLLGPGFVVGIGNGILLGYLMYRSGLLPKWLAILGLVGGPSLCLSGLAVLFGTIELGSTWQLVATIPEFFWELILGLYLTVKGFRSAAFVGRV